MGTVALLVVPGVAVLSAPAAASPVPGASADGRPGYGSNSRSATTVSDGSRASTTLAEAAPPAGYSVEGIDVSVYQGSIAWGSVAAAGVDFAYARASLGSGYTDPTFNANNDGAKANGLYFGAYHFARPDQSSGRQQADWFLDRARFANDGKTLPPMLDIEWGPTGTPTCFGLSQSQMAAWVGEFVNRVRERTGRTAMIYTNTYWWNPCVGTAANFGNHPLAYPCYCSSPGTLPNGWSKFTWWQWTDSGAVSGVSGNVDRDVFNGTMTDLKALAGTPPPAYSLAGDWDGNGSFTPAMVVRYNNVWRWFLKNSLSGGVADFYFDYGDADMVPIAGDWDGNGTFTPGVVDNYNNVRRWYLKNSNTGGVADFHFDYGDKNVLPVVGDWDGNGTFTPGVVVNEGGSRRWYLKNSNTSGVHDVTFLYGNANTWPVPGDWDGNGTWTAGIVTTYDARYRRWYLKNSLTGGVADVTLDYGNPGAYPVPGDWDGNGSVTPGLVENYQSKFRRWYLKNSLTGGAADLYLDYGDDAPYPYSF